VPLLQGRMKDIVVVAGAFSKSPALEVPQIAWAAFDQCGVSGERGRSGIGGDTCHPPG